MVYFDFLNDIQKYIFKNKKHALYFMQPFAVVNMKLNILNKQRKILETKITQKQATSDDLIDIFVFSQNYDGVQAVNENKEYV